MGTRSLTRVIPRQEGLSFSEGHDHADKAVVNIYRQYDGYPEGMGLDLANFLSEFTVVNGLGADSYKSKIANGAGCLAAQLVAHLKNGPVILGKNIFILYILKKENQLTYLYMMCGIKNVFL